MGKIKMKTAIYLLALCWCATCLTWRVNEADRQETLRFQIRVWQENGRAMLRTQDSIDAARKALEHDESKPALHL